MKRFKQRNSKEVGFTIVELLIVIIVIAVLAAISIVAYNGIQERSQSTKIISQANAYIKGLKLWEADLGRPGTSSCIAPPSYETCPNAMHWTTSVPNDTAFNAKLSEYSGVSTPQLGKYGDDNPKGLMWYHANYYGLNRSVLHYWVGVNSDCGLPNVLSPPYATFTLTGAKYTERTSNATLCMIEVSKW